MNRDFRKPILNRCIRLIIVAAVVNCLANPSPVRAADIDPSMIELLRPFAPLVGTWTAHADVGAASPAKDKVECTWGFREADGRVSLNLYFEKTAPIEVGLLTVDPKNKTFSFVVKDRTGNRLAFRGLAKDPGKPSLHLLRAGPRESDDFDRAEISLTKGGDKFLIGYSKKIGRTSFKPKVTIEAFREGPSNLEFEKGPFCVVTGGPGRIKIDRNGTTYFVACEAAKELALRMPEKYLVSK